MDSNHTLPPHTQNSDHPPTVVRTSATRVFQASWPPITCLSRRSVWAKGQGRGCPAAGLGVSSASPSSRPARSSLGQPKEGC